MAPDRETLARLHGFLVEECGERLDSIESILLRSEAASSESVQTLFREMHSIKGAAAPFGFESLTSLAHRCESVLEELRDGERSLDEDLRQALLVCCDALRGMLATLRATGEAPKGGAEEALARLSSATPVAADGATASTAPEAGSDDWWIRFAPRPDALASGVDPLRVFSELSRLGELEVRAHTDRLPGFDRLDPRELHLAWTLALRGVSEPELRSALRWLDGAGEIEIRREPLRGVGAPVPATAEEAAAGGGLGGASIRVATEKVDLLIDMLGELVISQSMVQESARSGDAHRLDEALRQLAGHTRHLQERVMDIRMVPVRMVFDRIPRTVHELARQLGRHVALETGGEETELDKTILEKLGDALVHLVRNAVDHGIEPPQERLAAGKSEEGRLVLRANHEAGSVVIEVADDGRGLDPDRIRERALGVGAIDPSEALDDAQLYDLIFLPGLSTATRVSDVSGRGVGLDVVRTRVSELGGSIEVRSTPGRGSCFTIRVPLTLALLEGQLVRVADELYVLPANAIGEMLRIDPERVHGLAGAGCFYRLRDEAIPLVRLSELFGGPGTHGSEPLIVVVEAGGARVGLAVHELLGQQQIVIKSIDRGWQEGSSFSAATILGDGAVALILDPKGVIELARRPQGVRSGPSDAASAAQIGGAA